MRQLTSNKRLEKKVHASNLLLQFINKGDKLHLVTLLNVWLEWRHTEIKSRDLFLLFSREAQTSSACTAAAPAL